MLHSEIQEAIPLLALGGLGADEKTQLEQHLDVCPACRALASDYQFVADELNAQVPLQMPPPELETKLLRRLPERVANDAGGTRATRSFLRGRQAFHPSRFAFVLALLVALVLAGTTAAFALDRQNSLAAARKTGTQAYTLDNLKLVPLTGSINGPDGYMYVAPNNQTALLWLTNMSTLDNDHMYQIWMVKDGKRTSGGMFRPGHDGRAIVFVDASEPWGSYQEIGITVEPETGSPGPTTPRIVGGKIY